MKAPQLAASGVYFKPVLALLPPLLRSPRKLANFHRLSEWHKAKLLAEELLKKELAAKAQPT